jgi:hypothetical protein
MFSIVWFHFCCILGPYGTYLGKISEVKNFFILFYMASQNRKYLSICYQFSSVSPVQYLKVIIYRFNTVSIKLNVVAYTCNPSTWEAEVGGPQV